MVLTFIIVLKDEGNFVYLPNPVCDRFVVMVVKYGCMQRVTKFQATCSRFVHHALSLSLSFPSSK